MGDGLFCLCGFDALVQGGPHLHPKTSKYNCSVEIRNVEKAVSCASVSAKYCLSKA